MTVSGSRVPRKKRLLSSDRHSVHRLKVCIFSWIGITDPEYDGLNPQVNPQRLPSSQVRHPECVEASCAANHKVSVLQCETCISTQADLSLIKKARNRLRWNHFATNHYLYVFASSNNVCSSLVTLHSAGCTRLWHNLSSRCSDPHASRRI
jgi:hypothetical protein